MTQQVEACHKLVGFTEQETIVLTGNTVAAEKRRRYWREKRVIFATPQILANDLRADVANAKEIVLLVIDEAHRAQGDHPYVQVRYTCFKSSR